jgi:SRSO17 transposase
MNKTGINPALYTQYLLASFDNFTGTNLAEILECSHDAVSDFLRGSSLKPRYLWDRVKKHLPLERRRRGALVLDDTVLDKNFSEKIEGAVRQWSGNAHKVITGIGLVHWLHYDPVENDYLPVDYRIWDETRDGKSKNDHAREMFRKALQRDFCPDWVLFDAWYASVALLKMIHRADLWFFCRMKSNRLVSLPDQEGIYQPLDQLEWSDEALKSGRLTWLRAFGWVKVFRIVRPLSGGAKEIQFYVTNNLRLDSIEEAKIVLGYRWTIEQYHRELKQLTGIERCQARKQRSQRNHIGYAILAWLHLWEEAKQQARTVYQTKKALLRDYLLREIKTPTVPVCLKTA